MCSKKRKKNIVDIKRKTDESEYLQCEHIISKEYDLIENEIACPNIWSSHLNLKH